MNQTARITGEHQALGLRVVCMPATIHSEGLVAPTVRIFLGTEDGQHRAERVFLFSVERVRDPARTYEIYIMKNLQGFDRTGWRTGFTNYRFAVPALAQRAGRAIYNDVDQIYLDDPAKLFDRKLDGHGYLAVSAKDTSVMLLDCERMGRCWSLRRAQTLSKKKLLALAAREPSLWGPLPGKWNARDSEYPAADIRLLHYTMLHTQPWQPFPSHYSYHHHPLGNVWLDLERRANACDLESRPPAVHADKSSTPSPSVWLLEGHRLGDTQQIRRIAIALGWQTRSIPLQHNALHVLPGFILGSSTASIRNKEELTGPWPDLVFCTGKRCSSAAQWVKKRSGGRTRIVNVGRPWCRLAAFDLIITTPQYRLPARPNVMHLTLPLGSSAQLETPHNQNFTIDGPQLAVLIGGNSTSCRMDREVGVSMAKQVNKLVQERGGRALVCGSPRTPPSVFRAFANTLKVPATLWQYGDATRPNPYWEFLNSADEVVVTGDSVSMLADALSTRQPVRVYQLPHSRLARTVSMLLGPLNWWTKSRSSDRDIAKQQGRIARTYDRLVESGVVTPPRDLRYLHKVLSLRGYLGSCTGTRGKPPPVEEELQMVVARVKQLVSDERGSC